MSDARRMSDGQRQLDRDRAKNLCEYCHTSEQWQYVPFTVDHIVPIDLGGRSEPHNLALACFHCNWHKSNKVRAVDPNSSREVPLFNPRRDNWNDHFIWSHDRRLIIGVTAIGRATIVQLNLNRERVLAIRAADFAVGRHPPSDDATTIISD